MHAEPEQRAELAHAAMFQDNDEQHGVYDRLFYSSTSSFLRSAAHPEASTFSFSSTTSASSSDESHEETVFPSATQVNAAASRCIL